MIYSYGSIIFSVKLDNFGNTPLLEAIKNGHDHVASLLVKAGAFLMMDDTGDFLCKVVVNKDVDLLKRLLAYGINPNARNYDYRTPLHIAASEGSYVLARLLLESGASFLCKDRFMDQYLSIKAKQSRERERVCSYGRYSGPLTSIMCALIWPLLACRWGNTPTDEAHLVGDKNLVQLFQDVGNSQSSKLVDHSQFLGNHNLLALNL